jgi:predicted small secreted protein
MKTRDWAIALALALCAATLAACGSSADGGDAQAAKEEAPLEFAACMRAHGIEMEDPKAGQGAIEVGGDPNDPTTKKALATCNGKLGAGQELTSEEDEKLNESALAFSQCMREEGIDMGDPEFLGPGKFHLDIAGLDTDSPAFKAAQEACQGKLPELETSGVGG